MLLSFFIAMFSNYFFCVKAAIQLTECDDMATTQVVIGNPHFGDIPAGRLVFAYNRVQRRYTILDRCGFSLRKFLDAPVPAAGFAPSLPLGAPDVFHRAPKRIAISFDPEAELRALVSVDVKLACGAG
jgi:hypothetical protein